MALLREILAELFVFAWYFYGFSENSNMKFARICCCFQKNMII